MTTQASNSPGTDSGSRSEAANSQRPVPKRKAALLAFAFAGLLIAAIVTVRVFQIQALMQPPPSMPPTTVTSAAVTEAVWERVAESVGTIAAAQGITIAAEIGGTVESIHFDNGSSVEAGQLLVQLDISTEQAQLRAAEADALLALREVERSRRLQTQNTISESAVDQAEAQHKKALAQVDVIRAAIEKKTIRAPFAGRIGIRQVNLGEVLNPGAQIVSLQALDTVFVDFTLPQQRLEVLRQGQKVRVTTDAYPGLVFEGKLSAINPDLNSKTRSIRLQATLSNPDEKLRPGMFARVETVLDQKDKLLVIPATAVLYSPFGDSVFVIERRAATEKLPAGLFLSQRTIRVGVGRGDFLAIEGVPAGAEVASSGVFKLSNDLPVKVDNRLAPKASEDPRPGNS